MLLSTIQSPQALDLWLSSMQTPAATYSIWDKYYALGAQAHKKKQFREATAYFEKCIVVCLTLLKNAETDQNNKALPRMLHQSGHNLAACQNAVGQGLMAKKTLEELHHQLMAIAACEQQARTVRLGVLGSIDQSLFSLTSQLAYLNQVNEIHDVILNTENTVTRLSQQLLNAA